MYISPPVYALRWLLLGLFNPEWVVSFLKSKYLSIFPEQIFRILTATHDKIVT